MKTLSRTFRLVVLAVIVIVVVVSCCNFSSLSDKRISLYSVEIGNEWKGEYVKWKDQRKFDDALDQVCWSRHGHGQGWYEFYIEADRTHRYKPCPPPKIRTVKVTKSKAADKIATAEPVANDPNVMHRIQSPNPGDIQTVLNALEPAP